MRNFSFNLITTLIAASLAVLSMPNNLSAREWSEEIQMTSEEGVNLTGGNYYALEVDSRDILHLLYRYITYQAEDVNRRQAVYQQFTRFGEAINDPIIIGEIVEWPPDSSIYAYDLCMDQDENVYILWGGNFYKNVTKLNREGEVIEPCIRLTGFGRSMSGNQTVPQLCIRSDGIIVFVDYITIQPDNFGPAHFSWILFTPEGEMIDSVVVLDRQSGGPNWFDTRLDSEDNLHVFWEENVNFLLSIYYSRITPDGEFLFDKYRLPGVFGNEDAAYNGMGLDGDACPLLLMNNDNQRYLVKFDHNMEREFQIPCGRRISSPPGWNGVFADNRGNYHVAATLQEDADSVYFMSYTQISHDGEIIDSTQWIHDFTVRGGARRASTWTLSKPFACRDGTAGVIWDDRRWYNYNNSNAEQFFMRYSESNQGIITLPIPNYPYTSELSIQSMYPNPFNNSISISILINRPSLYNLNLVNQSGQIVYKDILFAKHPGIFQYSFHSNRGTTLNLPSGSYFFQVTDSKQSITRSITLIR